MNDPFMVSILCVSTCRFEHVYSVLDQSNVRHNFIVLWYINRFSCIPEDVAAFYNRTGKSATNGPTETNYDPVSPR